MQTFVQLENEDNAMNEKTIDVGLAREGENIYFINHSQDPYMLPLSLNLKELKRAISILENIEEEA